MSGSPSPNGLVLFDTGPVLAFAVDSQGASLLRDRYEGRAAIVRDVEADLEGLQRNQHPGVAQAAKRALRSFGWLRREIVDDAAVLQRAERLRQQLQAFKRRPDVDEARSRKDWAESVTVAHAETLRAAGTNILIVANDDAARRLAEWAQFQARTSVAVLRAMIADGMLTRRQGWRLLENMRESGIDYGEVVASPQDL